MSFLPLSLYSSVSIALQHKACVLAVGENGTAEPVRRSAKIAALVRTHRSDRSQHDFKLMAQAKSCDQCAITLRAFLAQIAQKATALANHHQQTTARMQVMLVNFEMLSHLIDTPGQNRHLHLWRTCIGLVNAGISNDFRLFFDT